MLPIFTDKITQLYEETKTLLLNPQSYQVQVDISPARMYLGFIEQALQKPITRIASIAAFLRDTEGLMVSKMMPFALLKIEVMQSIEQRYHQSVKLVDCCAILSPTHAEELTKEAHEGIKETLS